VLEKLVGSGEAGSVILNKIMSLWSHPVFLFFILTAGFILSTKGADLSMLRDLDSADYREVYREVDGHRLTLHGFAPMKPAAEPRPAILFFHGGGWVKGTPASMAPFCRYLATRGIVSFTASYRLCSVENGYTVQDCVADARAALLHLREHAGEYQIDTDRIAIGGGSAGGHLAAVVGMHDPEVKAMVLFNPALVLTPEAELGDGFVREMAGRAGLFDHDAASISPATLIGKDQAPMLSMHGKKDWLLPAARLFKTRYEGAGNDFKLALWEGQEHGFYHLGKRKNRNFIETTATMDRFLARLGFLKGEPSIESFVSARTSLSPLPPAKDWAHHRESLRDLVVHHQYGTAPGRPAAAELSVAITHREDLYEGAAERIDLRIEVALGLPVRAVLVRPRKTKGLLPTIIKNAAFLLDYSAVKGPGKRAKYEKQKRLETEEKAFREAIARGFQVVKFLREDAAGDRQPRTDGGIFGHYGDEYTWGVIRAWAWTGSVVADATIRDWRADPKRLIATGHSRGGKTALCQGILDERIAVTAPSASGSGGTGSWRIFTPGGTRQTPAEIRKVHPRWFADAMEEFVTPEGLEKMPFDGHTLKALVAPRGLINTQGLDDRFANPVGTSATFDAAQTIYAGLEAGKNQCLVWRRGGHEQAYTDWMVLLDFAEEVFARAGD